MICRQLFALSHVVLVTLFLTLGLPIVANAQAEGKARGKGQENALARAEIQRLHQQIAALRKQRDVTLKRIRDIFGKMISQDKLTRIEIEAHRKHLIQECNALAEGSGTPQEKAAIYQYFDPIIRQLGHADQLDRKQIESLKKERHEMATNIDHQYTVAIKALEARAKALGGGGKKK